VTLLRVLDVWGFRYPSWAPLALRLAVACDCYTEDPNKLKVRFSGPEGGNALVHEFLYLKAGWSWGMVGRVNGALLRPDAFNYFVDEIRKSWPQGGNNATGN